MSTIGIHSSSRAFGRSTGGAPPVALPVPWLVPSAASLAGSPGAMTDSSTSRRSTAKRVGVPASGGRKVGAPSLAGGVDATDPADDPTDGAAEASGSVSGLTE
jgi:hypothetical protein